MNHSLYWRSVFSQRRELRQYFEARSQNCEKNDNWLRHVLM